MVFPSVWGKYAAVFDDDDILFSNWVEEFKKCAEENEGRILHSFAFAQDWENLEKTGILCSGCSVCKLLCSL